MINNSNNIIYRELKIDEISEAVNLVRKCFDKQIVNTWIYGCDGIVDFIKEQMELPKKLSNVFYFVAEAENKILGFAEFKSHLKYIFLNYIAVSSEDRAKGIGSELLASSLNSIIKPNHEELLLDVYEDNVIAMKWYNRLGFEKVFTSYLCEVELTGYCEPYNISIIQYPQAEAVQKRFGFSQFNLLSENDNYLIGRIGNDWFKLFDENILNDINALCTLKKLDQKRKFLILLKDDSISNYSNKQIKINIIKKIERLCFNLKVVNKTGPFF